MNKYFPFIAVPFLFISCTVFNSNADYYQIEVSQIRAPEKIILGDTLTFELLGKVGDDGCHQFASAEKNISDEQIITTLIGKVEYQKPGFATANYLSDKGENWMSYSSGKTFKTVPKNRGNFTIIINQPDGSKLQKILLVE